MLSSGQLENVGFSYIMTLIETSSPYGAGLARKPRCFTPNEHETLLRELRRVRIVGSMLQSAPEAFARVERALMQLKDVRRTLEKCAACNTETDCKGANRENAGCDAEYSENARSETENRLDVERLHARYAGNGADDIELSDVELFEVKRFLIRLEALADSYSEAFPEGLEGMEIRAFPNALDIIDPDGMRALTFRVSSVCSEPLAAIRAERRSVELALRRIDDAGEAGSASTDTEKTEEAADAADMLNAGFVDVNDKNALVKRRTELVADEEAEEARIRRVMTALLSRYAGDMLRVCQSIAELDLALAKAGLLVRYNGTIPEVSLDAPVLELKGMLNPMMDAALREKGRSFVPTDISLSHGSTVITGANMGGKSVALKTVALNVQLALCGFPVFCYKAAMPHFADIHLLCEELEDNRGGLSSFGGEMVRFDAILRSCRENLPSLVLLDEFARGTNPHEGTALVRAAVRYFNASESVFALITTHFDDVAKLANTHYQAAGLRDADKNALAAALAGCEGSKTRVLEKFMDYGLYPASKNAEPPRDAFMICRALNVPADFMRLAERERQDE